MEEHNVMAARLAVALRRRYASDEGVLKAEPVCGIPYSCAGPTRDRESTPRRKVRYPAIPWGTSVVIGRLIEHVSLSELPYEYGIANIAADTRVGMWHDWGLYDYSARLGPSVENEDILEF